MNKLTHFDASGQAHMVNVGDKPHTHRIAIATGKITMLPETFKMVEGGTHKKGDVLGIARIAGIQASKKTSDLIPLCHPLSLTHVSLDFQLEPKTNSICCEVRAETTGPTGVEMEALTAVSVAGLTVIDMVKALDPSASICDVRVETKSGGRNGDWSRN